MQFFCRDRKSEKIVLIAKSAQQAAKLIAKQEQQHGQQQARLLYRWESESK